MTGSQRKEELDRRAKERRIKIQSRKEELDKKIRAKKAPGMLLSKVSNLSSIYDTYSKQYNSRYQGGQGYFDSYHGDSADWLDKTNFFADQWNQQSRDIQTFIQNNADALDEEEVGKIRSWLQEGDRIAGGMRDTAKQENDYYSQWDTEDAFNAALAAQKSREEILAYDIEAGKKEVEDLIRDWEDYDVVSRLRGEAEQGGDVGVAYTKDMSVEEYYAAEAARIKEIYSAYDAYEKKYGSLDALDKIIQEKERYIQNATRVQDGARLAAVADPESELYDPEFSEYSGYVSKNDPVHDYINGNDIPAVKWMDMKQGYGRQGYDKLTDKEKATYNYYYNKAGKEAAQKYLSSIQESLNAREGAELAAGIPDVQILQDIFAGMVGLDQFGSGIESLLNGALGMDSYVPASPMQVAGAITRENREDKVWYNFKTGQWEDKVLGLSIGKTKHDLLSSVGNMAPSMLASAAIGAINPAAGAAIGNALMGASAAGNAYQEKINMGYSADQAMSYGLMVGISEATLQQMLGGISKLGGQTISGTALKNLNKMDNVFARFAKSTGGKLLMNAGEEALEEGLQSVIEPYLWQAVSGEEATVDWEETLYSALLGFATGGLFEGAEQIPSAVVAKIQNAVSKRNDVKFSFNVSQQDIDAYVDAAYQKENTQDYRKYAEVSEGLVRDVQDEIDITGYAHALRDNDIRHIKNSHGENTNEKYPVTKDDIKQIPWIVENYDKVFAVKRDDGRNGLIYVKVTEEGLVYYLEQATTKYGNEPLLVNKQMIKTGIEDIPNLKGLSEAITKKQSKTEFLNDLKQIQQVYAQSVYQSYSTFSISQNVSNVNDQLYSLAQDMVADDAAEVSDGDIPSAEGKALLKSTGKEVQVRKFTDIANDKSMVELEDGSVVPAKDVLLANTEEDVLFHFIATEENMTAEGANAAWQLWQANKNSTAPISAEAFRSAAIALWRAGYRGDAQILNAKDGSAAALSSRQRELIYEAAQRAAQAKADASQVNVDVVYAEAKKILQESGRIKGGYRAVTTKDISVKQMTRKQRAAYRLAEQIAPGIQGSIVVYNGGKKWGYYDPKTDTIYLNINAKWDHATMLAFTLGHELAHRAKRGSPAKFKAFADFLVSEYGKQGSDLETMVAEQMVTAKEDGIDMTEEEAFGEVVADACQKMLLDTDAGKRLVEFGAQSVGNHNYLQKIKQWLTELLDYLRQAFRNVEPDSLAAREFARFDENVKQILADMFVDMSIDAGEKLSTIHTAGLGEKITAQKDGIKNKVSSTQNTPYRKPAYDEWDVSVALEDAMDHADQHNDNLIKVGNMPNFITELIGIEGEFYIYRNHAYENMVSKKEAEKAHRQVVRGGRDIHFHNLGKQRMTDAILALEHPIMTIADSQEYGNPQIVMILPVLGNNDAPLYAALSFYENTHIKGEWKRKPHIVLTISERGLKADAGYDGHLEVINKAVENGKVLSFDKEKMRDYLSVIANHTRVGNITSKSLTDNIASFREFVNKFREKNNIDYKTPAGKDTSDRAMLVDLFEQMVTDSNEYKALQNYRKHMDEMLQIEEHLERVTAEIRRLSFAEGPRDTETLYKLKLQQKQAVNNLNNYDGILLRLEKSGVLSAMIERNRKQITQESFARAKEYYRERNERRESEIRQYYRESRRQAVERHDMAEIRQRIRKDVARLDSLLNKGTKKKNVKLGLQEFVGTALRLAKGSFLNDYNEYDMIRSGLQNSLLPEEKEAFDRCRELLAELDQIRSAKEEQKEQQRKQIRLKGFDPEQVMRQDDREETLKKELSRNMRILRDGNVFQRERAGAEDATAEQLADELLTAYQKLAETEYEHLQGLYSEKVYEQIEKTRNFLKGKAIKDMTSVELKELGKLYRMINETVSRADELFGAHRNEKISKRGDRIHDQLSADRDADMNAAVAKLKELGWSMLTPETAAAVIGSEELTRAIREVEATETVQQQDLEHAKQYAAEQAKKFNRKNWDTSKQVEFAGTEITIGQAMALYAYTERKAGRDHISGDGFVHSKAVPIRQKRGKLQISSKFIKDTTRAYRVTENMYDELGKLLSEEQKGYARAMRDYLAEVMGAKGNEVSRELYGIEMYGEKFYFPLKSAKNFLDSVLGAKRGEVKVTNQGFTNPLQEGASNAIVLEDFESVWAKHVQEMSNYHASAVAMENFNRLYNYRQTLKQEKTDDRGQFTVEEVKSSEAISLLIERKAVGGTWYLTKWMENINGGVRSDATEKLLSGLLGNFRKTAVLGNLSVIIQQPTAILRAAPYLGKDFLSGWKSWKTTTPGKGLIREMYRYCPVAGLKKMGGFDPSAGQTVRQYLFDGGDDAKGKFKKGVDKTNEVLGMGPEKADELAWSYLWLGCKKKTLRENRNLRAGSREHCEAAAELFTRIVRETQVYDSVMSKPLIMQSKNATIKGLTSFMNEPLKGLNQCIMAAARAKNGEISKGQAAAHIVCVAASNLLATAVSSLIYALRDDDEEPYWEKYLKHFSGGLLDVFIPLGSVPFVKDIISIAQGYGNERGEFALISDAWDGLLKLLKESKAETPEELEKEVWDKLEELGSVLNLSGVPVRNLIREARGLYYTAKRRIEGGVTSTSAGMKYAVLEGITGKETSKADQLKNAVAENDSAHILRIMGTYDEEDKALSAVRSAVKEVYLQGDLSEEDAMELLQVYADNDSEEAQDLLIKWSNKQSFEQEHSKADMTEGQISDWYEFAEPAGISFEIYAKYAAEASECKSDRDEDGKVIPDSKRDKILAVIDGLPISRKQKDALYFANEYAESRLDEAPWN